MASNPLVAQGTINRLKGSITVTDNPALNVTAPFLGKRMIGLRLEGQASVPIGTATGIVQSPEPYMMATVTVNMLKTQNLSAQYKARMESNSVIGDIVVQPDTSTLPTYQIVNCSITSVEELSFAGEDAGYVVTLTGAYNINSSLWNLV